MPNFFKIERIKIFIRCQKYLITIADNMQTNFDQFQEILLAMNEQYDGFVKTEWTEKSYRISKVIEILICKSC